MKKKNNFFIKLISSILVIILIFGIIILTNKPRESTIGETIFSYTILPIQNGFVYFKNWILGYKDIFPQINNLRQSNSDLETENKSLKAKMIDYDIIVSENRMLKEQMNLVEKYPEYTLKPAMVVSEGNNNWQDILVVNQGSNDGIKPNMTVITNEGLVGYVKEVSFDTSKILCITDPGNSVSGRINKTRDSVVCRGELGLKEKYQMKILYIPIGVELSEGDIVETSGIGGVYKKGIKIGQVYEVSRAQNTLENYAIINTSVDFKKLEYVAIIID